MTFHSLHLASVLALIALPSCGERGRPRVVAMEGARQAVIVRKPALYPETLEYDVGRRRFLVSSLRDGGVFAVDDQGAVSRVVDDPRLCSVLGIAVDAARGRVWAVNSDLGASLHPSREGPKRLAAVGTYDLATGETVQYVDLAPLSPGDHLLNGIALDSAGNAYVTDSFSPTIYKIDPYGRAAVFLRSEQFAGKGINLNGVVVHPDGYLLVVKKSDGALFKVPLASPSLFSKVEMPRSLVGGDGLILVGARDLVVIANQVPGTTSNTAFSLSSDDGWATALVRATQPLGDVYPTTGVLRDGALFVIHSKLNELLASSPEQRALLHTEATIDSLGRVTP